MYFINHVRQNIQMASVQPLSDTVTCKECMHFKFHESLRQF